jgi:hypothetical protein
MKNSITISIFVLLLSSMSYGQVDRAIIHLNDTIQIELFRVKFDKTDKVFEFYDSKYILSINGVPLLGTDGDYPKYQLSKALLTIGNYKYELQVDNMYNPWFGEKPNDNMFRYTIDGTEIRIKAAFSDGAGSYGAEWLIAGHSSIRSILTNNEEIVIGYILNN